MCRSDLLISLSIWLCMSSLHLLSLSLTFYKIRQSSQRYLRLWSCFTLRLYSEISWAFALTKFARVSCYRNRSATPLTIRLTDGDLAPPNIDSSHFILLYSAKDSDSTSLRSNVLSWMKYPASKPRSRWAFVSLYEASSAASWPLNACTSSQIEAKCSSKASQHCRLRRTQRRPN